MCRCNVEHHLSCPHLTVHHQMFHSQTSQHQTSHVTGGARLGCCSVIHSQLPFLGRSGFHLCTNRLWQWDLKSQIVEQLDSALQQTWSSQHQDQADMLEVALQTIIGGIISVYITPDFRKTDLKEILSKLSQILALHCKNK